MKNSTYLDTLQKHQLGSDQLKRYTNPENLPKSSRLRLPEPAIDFGQERAIKAINTALDIKSSGYHVFAVGENGLGKRHLITRLLSSRAKQEPTPKDLVYMHNFSDARRPIALSLPTGSAQDFQTKVHNLWHKAKQKLINKLLSDAHQAQADLIKSAITTAQNQHYDAINQRAAKHNLILSFRADGRTQLVAIDDKLPIDNQARNELLKSLSQAHLALENTEDEINNQLDQLYQQSALKALEPLFRPLLSAYAEHQDIINQLTIIQDDMVQNVMAIVNNDEDFLAGVLCQVPSRYSVNVLVHHKPNSGAPIVFEDLPTHLNLLGHIEYTTELGSVLTDVSMIRAGALHRANGGYLILEAQSLLEHPYAWQGLKRALQSKQIRISSLEQMLTLTGSLSLEPDGINLEVKVILLGEADLYYELLEFEPEFNAVFKIRADFHHDIRRTHDSENGLVLKMVDMIKSYQLTAFDNTAFAAILDQLSQIADDKNKLDLHADRLSQLLIESDRIAKQQNKKTVTSQHIKTAISDIHERTGYLKELYWQEIQNGQQIIKTQGQDIGQINALTVISYADSEFGLPARLSALIAPKFGHGEILDIERDVELGGSLHAKGMLIMASFLRSLFSEFGELNFSASLAFEQNYGHIDGDSATLAEACALLSALADVPIFQNIAITGSMNQLGEAQAIGGVNAKIAGFFDACFERGLTGDQGVIIPRTNISQLMLRDDIIAAVQAGKFAIYAVDNIYETLAILMDMPICDKNKKGEYKKNTLFGKIISRLLSWQDEDEKDKGKG